MLIVCIPPIYLFTVGKVSYKELGVAVTALGFNMTKKSLRKLMLNADTESTGELSMDQFLDIFLQIVRRKFDVTPSDQELTAIKERRSNVSQHSIHPDTLEQTVAPTKSRRTTFSELQDFSSTAFQDHHAASAVAAAASIDNNNQKKTESKLQKSVVHGPTSDLGEYQSVSADDVSTTMDSSDLFGLTIQDVSEARSPLLHETENSAFAEDLYDDGYAIASRRVTSLSISSGVRHCLPRGVGGAIWCD